MPLISYCTAALTSFSDSISYIICFSKWRVPVIFLEQRRSLAFREPKKRAAQARKLVQIPKKTRHFGYFSIVKGKKRNNSKVKDQKIKVRVILVLL